MNSLIPWRRKRKNEVQKADREKVDWYDRFFTNPFDSLFEESFFPTLRPFGQNNWWPEIDISEGKNDITVEAEIPGMEKDDIQICLDGRRLTIKGEKNQDSESKKKGIFRKERTYGYFNRSVELPTEVDVDSISAKYKRGVLKIEMKKDESAQQKAIPITTG